MFPRGTPPNQGPSPLPRTCKGSAIGVGSCCDSPPKPEGDGSSGVKLPGFFSEKNNFLAPEMLHMYHAKRSSSLL